MAGTTGFQKHWLEIEAERLARYDEMFRWNPASAHFYDAAELDVGQRVVDFGCGPGHAAIEFARRVGPVGHVHALDINSAFIRRAGEHAEAAGLGDRISAQVLHDQSLPLADASVDRVIVRNTLVYVADPAVTLREFRRVLAPGGLAHMIEGDWRLTCLEPAAANWAELVSAAHHAFAQPEIGRRLHGFARRAGFDEVRVQVLTAPDTSGRLRGMIDIVTGYARDGGTLAPQGIDASLKAIDAAIAAGTYLAVVPQFIVTARV